MASSRALLLPILALTAACPEDEFHEHPAGACAECRDEKCLDLVQLCDDDDCACMSACLGDSGVPGIEGCLDGCGLATRPARFVELEECVAGACPDEEDECATPADYVPVEGAVLTTTPEIGGGDGADCGFDDGLVFDPLGAVLQLQSVDGAVCVRIERVDEGAGSLANTSWRLARIRVGPLGRVSDVDEAGAAAEGAQLCWYSSHHNFGDWAHVWTGARRHDVELEEFGHGGERTFTLHTFAQGPLDLAGGDGGDCGPVPGSVEPIGEPLALFPVNP